MNFRKWHNESRLTLINRKWTIYRMKEMIMFRQVIIWTTFLFVGLFSGSLYGDCSMGCVNCVDVNTCAACSQGYRLEQQTCVQCPERCLNCSADGSCSLCESPYYGSHYPNICSLTCPVNCDAQGCSSDGICFKCQDIYYGARCRQNCNLCLNELCNSSSCIIGCKPGYFQSQGESFTDCYACEENCEECFNYTHCKQCKTGYFLLQANLPCVYCRLFDPNCTKCHYKPGILICESCEAGLTLTSNQCVPTRCIEGWEINCSTRTLTKAVLSTQSTNTTTTSITTTPYTNPQSNTTAQTSTKTPTTIKAAVASTQTTTDTNELSTAITHTENRILTSIHAETNFSAEGSSSVVKSLNQESNIGIHAASFCGGVVLGILLGVGVCLLKRYLRRRHIFRAKPTEEGDETVSYVNSGFDKHYTDLKSTSFDATQAEPNEDTYTKLNQQRNPEVETMNLNSELGMNSYPFKNDQVKNDLTEGTEFSIGNFEKQYEDIQNETQTGNSQTEITYYNTERK